MQVRLLPLISFACIVLLLVKVADLVQGTTKFSEIFLISGLKAEEPKKEEKKEDKPGGKPEEKKDAEAGVSTVKPVIAAPPEYSETELEILKRLAKRREELDAREKQLDEKDTLLNLSEQKINDKLNELKSLKAELQELLTEYNGKENEKIQSLVKIYETMKPKPAADIFEQLDMTTLLMVVSHMKEAKVAPILANMTPAKAKEVTMQYAKQKKLIEEKQQTAGAPTPTIIITKPPGQ